MPSRYEPVETWERRPGAACAPLGGYRRREPGKTLLHQVVRERLEPFLAGARDRSATGRGLPAHVERDLRAYLDCGLLGRGFARIRCPDCGFERLVAFSCKARSCPSCNARRMEDAADHLCHDVFPQVPVRQWVISFPRRIRFLAARDPAFCSRLLDLFTRAVFAWQRRRGRLAGVADPRTGGCTAVQRFGSAINLNVHFHTLIPDGVFDLSRPGRARFVRLPAPSDEELERILTAIIRKVARHIGRDGEVERAIEEDAFAELQAAEVDRRMRFPDPFKHARHSAYLDGFSLHAGVRIHENDREGLERLCRYAVRPPFALHRLSQASDGQLLYKMKRPRSGALFLLLTPDQLLARIATLVPPPRTHALRYHGVFAPNSKHRARVVPGSGGGKAVSHAVPAEHPSPQHPPPKPEPTPAASGAFALAPPPAPPAPDRLGPRYRVPWAELLRKVFSLDVLACPQCGGRMELIAFIAEAGVAKRILDHLGLVSTGPPVPKPRAPDEAPDPGPEYDGADPTYDD
jgi:Putative transposase/Transposase zinc-binding domain